MYCSQLQSFILFFLNSINHFKPVADGPAISLCIGLQHGKNLGSMASILCSWIVILGSQIRNFYSNTSSNKKFGHHSKAQKDKLTDEERRKPPIFLTAFSSPGSSCQQGKIWLKDVTKIQKKGYIIVTQKKAVFGLFRP